jgi:hypothetical protein
MTVAAGASTNREPTGPAAGAGGNREPTGPTAGAGGNRQPSGPDIVVQVNRGGNQLPSRGAGAGGRAAGNTRETAAGGVRRPERVPRRRSDRYSNSSFLSSYKTKQKKYGKDESVSVIFYLQKIRFCS